MLIDEVMLTIIWRSKTHPTPQNNGKERVDRIMQSHNKFDTDDFIMLFLKSGTTHSGKLKRPYDNLHPYWYIKLEGDETLLAIPDHEIESVIRPSQDFIKSFGAFIQAASEDKKEDSESP